MTKEELTRNLKYTEKKHRNDIVNTFDTNISTMCSDVLKVLENCIELPNGATNGDVIKAMFPNVSNSNLDLVDVLKNAKTWWNAPFKRGGEE